MKKKHRIFNKGETVYGLLSSGSIPDAVMPIKCKIIDVQWDSVNPKYKIHILKFYDNYGFLRENFFDCSYIREFKGQSRPMQLNAEDYKNKIQLEERLREKDRERFYVIIDSIMCTKTRLELQDLFEKVQFYLISKNLKRVRQFVSRPFFKGPLSVDSVKEFDTRFRKGWADKFKGDFTIDKYLRSLK